MGYGFRTAWRWCAFAAATWLGVPAAYADWTGKGELGLVVARGNADATSANAKIDVSKELDSWKNAAYFAVLYGRNASFTTAQRLEGRWQTDYNLTERLFWLGALRAEQDRFSGFAYQASASTGVGYKFIDTDRVKLTGTLGAGYRRLRPEVLIKSPEGEVLERIREDPTGDAVANGSLDYSHELTKTTKLLDKLLIESGNNNTATQNDLAVQVSINEALALSVGYGVRYNTNPPLGAKKVDQLTTINLVYNLL